MHLITNFKQYILPVVVIKMCISPHLKLVFAKLKLYICKFQYAYTYVYIKQTCFTGDNDELLQFA